MVLHRCVRGQPRAFRHSRHLPPFGIPRRGASRSGLKMLHLLEQVEPLLASNFRCTHCTIALPLSTMAGGAYRVQTPPGFGIACRRSKRYADCKTQQNTAKPYGHCSLLGHHCFVCSICRLQAPLPTAYRLRFANFFSIQPNYRLV